jgi:hypothetical protein
VSLPDLGGAASRIGTYFDAVTLIPTSLVVTYVFALAATGAWDGTPDWGQSGRALAGLGIGGAAALAGVSLAVSLTLHPLQFGMTQLLEGYWGPRGLARGLAVARTLQHRERRKKLLQMSSDATRILMARTGDVPRDPRTEEVPAVVQEGEATRLLQNYPENSADVMPTRLGNVLRTYERQAGAQYGLPIITVAPHVTLIAAPEQAAYIADQRTELDRAVRLCWLSGVAAVLTVVFLWRSGWWLLLAAVPYSAAYLFYRGAVIVAADYGTAVATVLDLNRFALYERFGVPRPLDSEAERRANAALAELLRRQHVYVEYERPETSQA